ncbi:MAG: hypothetical protein K0R65_1973 [Crocinitomicaceae bacterium]|jgi:hypothetical protein|nr:hypothetical protein [Crocinitomicaceae bacterium]
MHKNHLIFALVLFTALLSCKKEDNEVDFHHEYFPLDEGTFAEYTVTRIYHDDASDIHDTTVYTLKTVIGDTVIDNEGRVARKMERYVFNTLLQEYKIQDVWMAIIDQERAELVEENQRKIKLVFAPSLTKEWDMNAFNSYDPVILYYKNIHKPFTAGSLDFEKTVTVEEDSTKNLIQYKRKFEVYAEGVGLVRKHYQDFSINNFNETLPVKGEEIFYTIINYGKE